MIYPTLLSQESDLHHLVMADGATNFYIRSSSHLSTFLIHIHKNEITFEGLNNQVLEQNIRDAFQEIKFPNSSTIVATHNMRTNAVNQSLEWLLKKLHQDRDDVASTLMNYLVVINSSVSNCTDIELIDIIRWNDSVYYKFMPYPKRLTILQEQFQSQQGAVYVDDNKTIFLTVAKAITSSLPFQVGMDYDNLKEKCNNIFSKIVIYGQETYSFYCDKILKIEELCNVVLKESSDVRFQKEFIQLERRLTM